MIQSTHPRGIKSNGASSDICWHGSKLALLPISLPVSLPILIAKVDGEVLLALLSWASFSEAIFLFLGLPIGIRAENLHGSPRVEHRPQDG
jgi:hypothetical protein